MPHTIVHGQAHIIFPGPTRNSSIRVRRRHPFGAATFVVYQTGNPDAVLGAGSCAALTAMPNYIEVMIPAGVGFTVQSVDNDIDVERPVNF